MNGTVHTADATGSGAAVPIMLTELRLPTIKRHAARSGNVWLMCSQACAYSLRGNIASRSTHRAKAPGLRFKLGSMWRQSICRGWRSVELAYSRSHSKTFTPPSQASRWVLCSRTFS